MSTGGGNRPPQSVLDSFRLSGRPTRISGGQSGSFRVGGAVLKRVEEPEETSWICELLTGLEVAGVRVPQPLESRHGGYVVGGWSATEFVTGEDHPVDHWSELLDAGRRFHEALKEVEAPAFLQRRSHRWAFADRVVWDETALQPIPQLAAVISRTLSLREPIQQKPQLIHGDLCGNVLFAPNMPPAIIDVSPFKRPAAWADAIVAVDAMVWFGADSRVYDMAANDGDNFLQIFIRALGFRLIAFSERVRILGGSFEEDLRLFEPVVTWCEQQSARS